MALLLNRVDGDECFEQALKQRVGVGCGQTGKIRRRRYIL
jgi:hypothetical protein